MANIVDAPQSKLSSTVSLVDKFYNFQISVDSNRYEVVYSYFFEITKSKSITQNFTTLLFRIATLSETDVLILLDEFKGKNSTEVNYMLALYLNSIKSKTTLYGINNPPIPNEVVQRNIVI